MPALAEEWAQVRFALRTGSNGDLSTSEEATREWWAAFNTRVLRRLGMECDARRPLEGLWETFGRAESWELFPEVRSVLAELRARGYRLGIVSNWDSRLMPICESLGLASDVDFILASSVAGAEKPDPRIFRLALSRAGVSAERAIHVGDDFEADVLGARRAGIDAVLVSRTGGGDPERASIRSLDELLALLP